MTFNVLDAAKLLDEKILNDTEVKLLIETREGVLYDEVKDKKAYKTLSDNGFVQRLPLSHPRARISIPAVVPTEAGVTVLIELDKRYRHNSEKPVAPYEEVPENASVSKENLREPTDKERPKQLAETGDKNPKKK